jgi:O-antigen/teichoic acid export membrane protein
MSLANVANAVVSFAAIAYFARTLGAEEIGVFFIFEALLNILILPADFGIRSAAEKRLSERTSPNSLLTTAFLLKSGPLLVIAAVILLLRGPINGYLGANVAVWLVVAIVTREFAQQGIQVLRGELRVGESAVPWLSQSATWAGAGVVLVDFGFGGRGQIKGLITGYLI